MSISNENGFRHVDCGSQWSLNILDSVSEIYISGDQSFFKHYRLFAVPSGADNKSVNSNMIRTLPTLLFTLCTCIYPNKHNPSDKAIYENDEKILLCLIDNKKALANLSLGPSVSW